jgi:ribosomal protein S18 acetylase RimI-like enzyme
VEQSISIRSATKVDDRAIADLWLRSRAASVSAIPPAVHTDAEVQGWFSNVVLPTHEVWVAQLDDGSVVGLLVLVESWVDQLYVDPTLFDRGVGSRLLAIAKRQRPRGLDLWTFESNHGARRFYERRGFTVVDSTDGDNEEVEPDLRYRWDP